MAIDSSMPPKAAGASSVDHRPRGRLRPSRRPGHCSRPRPDGPLAGVSKAALARPGATTADWRGREAARGRGDSRRRRHPRRGWTHRRGDPARGRCCAGGWAWRRRSGPARPSPRPCRAGATGARAAGGGAGAGKVGGLRAAGTRGVWGRLRTFRFLRTKRNRRTTRAKTKSAAERRAAVRAAMEVVAVGGAARSHVGWRVRAMGILIRVVVQRCSTF